MQSNKTSAVRSVFHKILAIGHMERLRVRDTYEYVIPAPGTWYMSTRVYLSWLQRELCVRVMAAARAYGCNATELLIVASGNARVVH